MHNVVSRQLEASLVIITFNRSYSIRACLDSLEKQTVRPLEVIVIDSSTNKDTEEVVADRDVVYRHLAQRTYQPRARNMALEICHGDVVAFIDDDTVCSPTWLENILEGYSFENIVGTGGPVINCDNELRPLVKEKRTDKNQNYFKRSGESRIVTEWVPSRPVRTQHFIGANMSFRKEALLQVGGFDEFYSSGAAYKEETDPQVALLRKGYGFMYMPGAMVFHLHHKSGGIRSGDQSNDIYWRARNHRYLVDKYFSKWFSRPAWIFWSIEPPCLWLCLMAAVYRRSKSPLQWIKGLWL
ncbi:glycosyltransferase family 2 protein [Chloroflexota bacterium]